MKIVITILVLLIIISFLIITFCVMKVSGDLNEKEEQLRHQLRNSESNDKTST